MEHALRKRLGRPPFPPLPRRHRREIAPQPALRVPRRGGPGCANGGQCHAPTIPTPLSGRTRWKLHPPRKRSPPKTTARLGISGAFPWAWTYSQVCRGPEARMRSGKPRPAPVSRPGSRLKSSESDPKTEAVEASVAGDPDKTLSRFCPVQKSKNFVSRGQEHSAALRVPVRLGGKSLLDLFRPASGSGRASF